MGSSSPDTLHARVQQAQAAGRGDALLSAINQRGYYIDDLDALLSPQWADDMQRAGRMDVVDAAERALEKEGSGGPQSSSGHLTLERPVATNSGYLRARFERLATGFTGTDAYQVVRAPEMYFAPPPAIALDTEVDLEILRLLAYAGTHYQGPDCPAAVRGIEIFKLGRDFAARSGRDWIGTDFDYTMDSYQITGSPASMLAVAVARFAPGMTPTAENRIGRYPVSAIQTAKPGYHELILGMMVGFAHRAQGIARFDQWNEYQPQVRIITTTWPDRVMRLANEGVRILSLMAGRLPGQPMTMAEVDASRAFTTLDQFVAYETALLSRFQGSQFDFSAFAPGEQDILIHLFRRGKGHYFKPEAAIASIWGLQSPEELGSWMMFDDSGEVMRFCRRDLVRPSATAVQTHNPFVDKPWNEVQETGKFSFPKERAVQRLVTMESHSYMPSLMQYLENVLAGRQDGDFGLVAGAARYLRWESPTAVGQHSHFHWDLQPVPRGTIFQIHDTYTTAYQFYIGYVEPTERLKRAIARVAKAAGGRAPLERGYYRAERARVTASV